MSILKLNLPKYTVELPITKRKVTYRPFTVKEEKILLLAKEDGSTDVVNNAIEQIINNCTYGVETLDSLNKIDAEYLFIQLRKRSFGEGVEINGICSKCSGRTKLLLNYDNVEVKNADVKLKPIQLTDDVWVTLKYPTLRDSLVIEDSDGITAIALMIDTIIDGEESKLTSDYTMDERIEFVESMTTSQIELFKEFFNSAPSLELNLDYECGECGAANNIHIEGIENFFS